MSCKISWSQLAALWERKKTRRIVINLTLPSEVSGTNSTLVRLELERKASSAAAGITAWCPPLWGSAFVHTCIFSEGVKKWQKGTQNLHVCVYLQSLNQKRRHAKVSSQITNLWLPVTTKKQMFFSSILITVNAPQNYCEAERNKI